MTEQPTWVYFIIGVLGTSAAFLTAYVPYRKWRPDVAKVKVETVDVNVRMMASIRDDAVDSWERARGERDDARREWADTRRELADVVARMDRIEKALRHEQEQRRLSNAYARTLAEVLREHHMPVPPPPDGLDLD